MKYAMYYIICGKKLIWEREREREREREKYQTISGTRIPPLPLPLTVRTQTKTSLKDLCNMPYHHKQDISFFFLKCNSLSKPYLMCIWYLMFMWHIRYQDNFSYQSNTCTNRFLKSARRLFWKITWFIPQTIIFSRVLFCLYPGTVYRHAVGTSYYE